jgi:two-component system phosphate regulon sensor histidine kinase PhoR
VAFEKAKLYKEVEEYSRELEKRVEERTAQLHQLQENQRQMMLDISHKLQNPLTVVKGELNLLQKQMPHNNMHLLVFEKSIDDVSKFVYDLLHLARLEADTESVEKKRLNMSELLSEHLEYFETMLVESDITLVQDIDSHIHMDGNREKLEELVTNLLSNAVKYMGNKSEHRNAEIEVSLKKSQDTVVFIVTDNGIGIEKEDVSHIFERFYRAESGRGTNSKGTGLGLAICKKITEIHNGNISVESELGKGTKITVTF